MVHSSYLQMSVAPKFWRRQYGNEGRHQQYPNTKNSVLAMWTRSKEKRNAYAYGLRSPFENVTILDEIRAFFYIGVTIVGVGYGERPILIHSEG